MGPVNRSAGVPAESASADIGVLLADTVARLRRAMRRAARAADPGNPLSVAQLEVLSCVADQPGIRPGQIARRLMLAANSVTTLVNALHTRGLVERTHSADDARAIALSPTPAGRQAVEGWKTTNTAILRAALDLLDERNRSVLAEALPGMRQLAEAVDALAETGLRPE
ncbi:MarR family transcriptional regulator [Actinomadura sp. DC4]|uniref:MarR family winged helix-turn-helix transcriptional regulator n=1 Tax=Actinomadura sp. DC4 TaxID=3055069 RepID=UPI0025AF2ABD|nr:MarR family transcriptional regulator [Actinomadura sp. DC4]MDN3356485.1 MarR family transcriptional regulator [Actinomadura sp. DC4]